MLVFRCQNGIVLWLLERTGRNTGRARCLRDQLTVAMAPRADATWEQSLVAITQHTVALAGAIVQVVAIPASF